MLKNHDQRVVGTPARPVIGNSGVTWATACRTAAIWRTLAAGAGHQVANSPGAIEDRLKAAVEELLKRLENKYRPAHAGIPVI